MLPDHLPTLFRLAVNDSIAWRWQGFPRTRDGFETSLWSGTLDALVVSRVDSDEVIGFASLFGANFQHGTCHFLFGLSEQYRMLGWAGEGAMLALNFAFDRYSFRKLVAEAGEDRFSTYSGLAGRVFVVEGRLKEHVFSNGRYQDLYMLAITRDGWRKWQQQLRSCSSAPRDLASLGE